MFDNMKFAIAIIIVLVVSFGLTYKKGRSDGKDAMTSVYLKEKQQWEDTVAKSQGIQDAKVDEVVAKFETQSSLYKAEIGKLKNQNTKIVQVYVPQKVDTAIPKGFVELHNTSAAGQPLNATQSVNATDTSPYTLSDVGSVIAENYYNCNDMRVKLESLQDIVIQFQSQQKGLVK